MVYLFCDLCSIARPLARSLARWMSLLFFAFIIIYFASFCFVRCSFQFFFLSVFYYVVRSFCVCTIVRVWRSASNEWITITFGFERALWAYSGTALVYVLHGWNIRKQCSCHFDCRASFLFSFNANRKKKRKILSQLYGWLQNVRIFTMNGFRSGFCVHCSTCAMQMNSSSFI